MEDWEKKLKLEEEADKKAIEEVIKSCKDTNIDKVFATVFDTIECPTLYIEWMLDNYWAIQMPKLLVDLERIHEELVKRGHTEDNSLDFNDMDDYLFYIPAKDKKVLAHTSQNRRHLYIFNKASFRQEIHIRRYWDKWELRKDDKWDKEEVDDFIKETQEKGYVVAIKKANWFKDEYADDYEDNPYPHRLSLDHYKNNNFECRYKDFRDEGYIASWINWKGKVDGALMTHHELKAIFECFVPSMIYDLFEEERNDR